MRYDIDCDLEAQYEDRYEVDYSRSWDSGYELDDYDPHEYDEIDDAHEDQDAVYAVFFPDTLRDLEAPF